ncbi:DUF2867 domain-containing protein [Nocardioides flavescens]|uniref:DUF2867 domain-containing protein n=1 Tax=Nocardioides flavescens TaxID=2691959 RepID=A0A6L7EZI0_9ACTN|nr:DUF2867 domain-containing protein [Nocardioides flavescens]
MHRRLRLHRSTRASTLLREPDDVWVRLTAAGLGPHWYVDAAPLVVRGLIDRAVGGEGRRWPVPEREQLETGDQVGFWRVTQAEKHTLELVADVRSPGRVVLTTAVTPTDDGCRVTQDVAFEPDGLVGQLYMLTDIAARETVIELIHRRLLAELG